MFQDVSLVPNELKIMFCRIHAGGKSERVHFPLLENLECCYDFNMKAKLKTKRLCTSGIKRNMFPLFRLCSGTRNNITHRQNSKYDFLHTVHMQLYNGT